MQEVVSEISFYPLQEPSSKGHVGFCSCLFQNQLLLNSIAVYRRRQGGFRLLYPCRQLKNGKLINCFYPISKEVGKAIEDAVTRHLTAGLSNLLGE